jgi:hypothetical protein
MNVITCLLIQLHVQGEQKLTLNWDEQCVYENMHWEKHVICENIQLYTPAELLNRLLIEC